MATVSLLDIRIIRKLRFIHYLRKCFCYKRLEFDNVDATTVDVLLRHNLILFIFFVSRTIFPVFFFIPSTRLINFACCSDVNFSNTQAFHNFPRISRSFVQCKNQYSQRVFSKLFYGERVRKRLTDVI